jgi:hypothetical protein
MTCDCVVAQQFVSLLFAGADTGPFEQLEYDEVTERLADKMRSIQVGRVACKAFVSRGRNGFLGCNFCSFIGLRRKWGRGGVIGWIERGEGSMNWAGISSLWTGAPAFRSNFCVRLDMG